MNKRIRMRKLLIVPLLAVSLRFWGGEETYERMNRIGGRKIRFLEIRRELEFIRFCMNDANWEINKAMILSTLLEIEKKIHHKNDKAFQMKIEDAFINKIVPFASEIRLNGLTERSRELFNSLYRTYKKFYGEVRLELRNDRNIRGKI